MKYILIILLVFPIIGFSQKQSIATSIDTVPIIMQVCDTAYGSYTAMTSRVWWMKGYMVSELIYLDQEKLPLRKSIVVWQTKEIKKCIK